MPRIPLLLSLSAALAGFATFAASYRVRSLRLRAFIAAFSIGVMGILLVEVAGHILEMIENLAMSAADAMHTLQTGSFYGLVGALGFAFATLALWGYEEAIVTTEASPERSASFQVVLVVLGLGLQNLCLGLALGPGFEGGINHFGFFVVAAIAIRSLFVGFAVSLPAAPRVSWEFRMALGLLVGCPTMVGAFIGGLSHQPWFTIFNLSIALGAILWTVMERSTLGTSSARRPTLGGMLLGFGLALLGDLLLRLTGGVIGDP